MIMMIEQKNIPAGYRRQEQPPHARLHLSSRDK